jgi:2',3'-cyclic-nucleotide 2'-phosphodiesterase (5'-nucleotidase family)
MITHRSLVILVALVALVVPLGIVSAHNYAGVQADTGMLAQNSPEGAVALTLLHNNDGESSLLPLTNPVATGDTTVELPVGGVASFETVVEQNIADARSEGNAVLTVYAGDAFLASATLICSQQPGSPVYDSVAQRQIPYDAHVFGNHEFDYGPDFLEEFIRGFEADGSLNQPFLSANLDFSGEPGFADLIDADGVINVPVTDGRVIGGSAVMTDTVTGETFGIVSATTWLLENISSPRNVQVTTDDLASTATAVQAEIDHLYDDLGLRKIIFVSHLQDIENDQALIALLSRVDLAVAGGGDELLQNPGIPDEDELLPGEASPVAGTYPIEVTDADGRTVYVVTTSGNYRYVGRLDAMFDAEGEVISVQDDSYIRRVIPDSPEADELGLTDTVTPDPDIVASVYDPLEVCLEDFATTTVATTEVLLDVSRNTVRTKESNAGNMIADSFLFAYDRFHDDLGLPARGEENPVIAVTNGGGIRQNAGDVLPTSGSVPGNITRQNTLDVLPFPNFASVLVGLTPEEMKAMFENSASGLPGEFGGFLQVGGVMVTYDTSQPVGSRVVSVELEDGTPIVQDGEVVAGAPTVDIVTNSFTASGGDSYDVFAGHQVLQLPLSYEQAWREYMQMDAGLGGLISSDDPRYQPGGEGRIEFVQQPTPTPTPTPEAPPAGRATLTARVYVDARCDGFFKPGLDVPIGDAAVTLTFANGATMTRSTRPFGIVSFYGFDPSDGVTVSVDLPDAFQGYLLESCPSSPGTVTLSGTDFAFGYKFVRFGAAAVGEVTGP